MATEVSPELIERLRAAVTEGCSVRNVFEQEAGDDGGDFDLDNPLYVALDALLMPVLELLRELPEADDTRIVSFSDPNMRGD